MKVKLLRKLICAACLTGMLAACNDDDYNGPSPYDVNATYTNQLSAGANAGLSLLYSGEELIGKDVYFKLKDARTGYLSLKQVLPGELETNIDNIPLTAKDDHYAFEGKATTATGIVLDYSGQVEKGKLSLALSNVTLPDNLLKGRSLFTVESADAESDYKTGVTLLHTASMIRIMPRTKPDGFLVGALFPATISQLVSSIAGRALGTVVNRVEFRPDGTIVADYAAWPEGYGVMDAIPPRPDTDYTPSPVNLATYYFTDAETMYVVPNVDQIIRAVQQNATKQSRGLIDPKLEEYLTRLYAQLSTWAREGFRLRAVKNPYIGEGYATVYKYDKDKNLVVDEKKKERYEGDYLLEVELDQLAVVGLLLEAIPYVAPDLAATPLADIPALADYTTYIKLIFPGVETVGELLTAAKAFGDNCNFELGLLFNNPAN